MKSAKFIIIPAIFIAILIGGQLALSAVSGIEIVTVLFLTFCFKYGVRQGLLVATAFSLLRCLIFGFFPAVLVLYLVYYNLFALVFGGLGNLYKREYSIKAHVILILVAIGMTVAFTLLDTLITPAFYGYTLSAQHAYFIASLYTMVTQIICVLITTLLLFPPLLKILK